MSVLTVPLEPHQIQTVAELARDPRPVSSFSDTFYLLAKDSTDPAINTLATTYIVHYEFEEAIRNCSQDIVVMCESTSTLQNIIRSQFTKNGVSSMYMMKESMFHFGVSFVTQKDSIYTAK